MSGWHVALARSVKNRLVPDGFQTRAILTGPLKGIRMDLDLRSQSQLYLGLFEAELHPWIRRLSAGVRTVVDVGAAHGEYTLFALLKTRAERVVALEPDPAMAARLQRNLDCNAVDSARLWFHHRSLGVNDSADSMSVETLSRAIVPPCLVKMDIDGGEAAVLNAAASSGFLQMRPLRWIIETHSVSLEELCVSILESNGYRIRIIPNAWWRTVVPELRVSEQNRWLAAVNDGSTSWP